MYPSCEVQRIKEVFFLFSAYEDSSYTFTGHWTPAARIIGRNCLAVRWSDKRRRIYFFKGGATPLHMVLPGVHGRGRLSTNWVIADCWSFQLWCFSHFSFSVHVNQTSAKVVRIRVKSKRLEEQCVCVCLLERQSETKGSMDIRARVCNSRLPSQLQYVSLFTVAPSNGADLNWLWPIRPV